MPLLHHCGYRAGPVTVVVLKLLHLGMIGYYSPLLDVSIVPSAPLRGAFWGEGYINARLSFINLETPQR